MGDTELEPLAGARTQGVRTRLERRRVDEDPSAWLKRQARR